MQLDISSATRVSAELEVASTPRSSVPATVDPQPGIRVSIPSPQSESPVIQRPVAFAEEAGNDDDVVNPDPSGIREEPRRGTEADQGSANEAERDAERSDNRESERRSEGELTPEEQAELRELKARDREVRQHELAHQVVGGQYTGAPSFTLERGPDGQLYAVSGQVPIDTSPVPDDPEATVSKMRVVRAAALAPANPSPEDIQVALEAMREKLDAQAELRAERQEQVRETLEEGSDAPRERSLEVFRDIEANSEANPRPDNGSRLDTSA